MRSQIGSGFDMPFADIRRDTKIRLNAATAEVEVIRNSSRIPRPVMPLVALIFQLTPPSKKQPCLLSFSEAKAVFGKVIGL